MARNVTMADWGFLQPGQYLIHDRDGKFCPAFQRIIDAVGVQRVVLPSRSPNLNAYAERWVRSVKDEVLSRLILLSEHSLRHALTQYEAHYHTERPHQGKGNVVLLPTAAPDGDPEGPVRCREQLGGLLKYYIHDCHEAACVVWLQQVPPRRQGVRTTATSCWTRAALLSARCLDDGHAELRTQHEA
jgi:putative transposase